MCFEIQNEIGHKSTHLDGKTSCLNHANGDRPCSFSLVETITTRSNLAT